MASEKIKEAVWTAMKDDGISATASSIRALLEFSTTSAKTPFGVYYHSFPMTPDFKAHSYITYYFIGGSGGQGYLTDARLREVVLSVTAWSEQAVRVDRILRRVEMLLHECRHVSKPTSQSALHDIRWDSAGPDLFDDDYKVYYRAEQYRIWYRDDIAS